MKRKPLLFAVAAFAAIGQASAVITTAGDTVNATSGTVTVGGNATVNGTLTVQPAVTTSTSTTVTPGTGIPTNIGGVYSGTGGDVILAQTLIDTSVGNQSTTGAGGATIKTNGDTELKADSVTNTTVNYGRAVTFEVAQAGNANPVGLAIAGTEKYYLVDTTGVQVPGTPVFATEAALNAYIAGLTPEAIYALDNSLGTQGAVPGTGGNLMVHGQTTTNGIDNTGDKITNLAAGTAPTDAANVGQVDAAVAVETAARIADVDAEEAARIADVDAEEAARIADVDAEEAARIADVDAEEAARIADVDAEEAARIADVNAEEAARIAADDAERIARESADTALGIRITDEEAARIADVNAEEARAITAENALGGRITTETNDRIAADNALGVRIDNEATTRAAADVALGNRITTETNDRIAADTALGNRITTETNNRIAADNQIIADYKAADRQIRKDIDKNTRGIAMVAAMTNTTIDPGKKQAIDFNMAAYEGEAGFAFGYAYRVNENLQIQTAGASTTDFEEAVVRLGVSYQW